MLLTYFLTSYTQLLDAVPIYLNNTHQATMKGDDPVSVIVWLRIYFFINFVDEQVLTDSNITADSNRKIIRTEPRSKWTESEQLDPERKFREISLSEDFHGKKREVNYLFIFYFIHLCCVFSHRHQFNSREEHQNPTHINNSTKVKNSWNLAIWTWLAYNEYYTWKRQVFIYTLKTSVTYQYLFYSLHNFTIIKSFVSEFPAKIKSFSIYRPIHPIVNSWCFRIHPASSW